MFGIDISAHNGNINFDAVKNAGVEVVIIKATEGINFTDSMVNTHYNNAVGKFNIGFYHFMSEKTDPAQQAIDFYNVIKDKKYNVLPCLDIEVNTKGRTASQITNRCLIFLNKFKELSGQDCMIYTGGYFGRDLLDNRIKNYPAWIAHYGVKTPMATGFNNVVGHQYAETGHVSGINGNVDVNNFTEGVLLSNTIPVVSTQPTNTIDYNGWVARLQKECNNQGFSNQVIDNDPGPITIAGCPTLKIGAKGDITKLLQEKLRNLGYYMGDIDGKFGDITFKAVKKFQSDHNLSTDGIVGKNTWTALVYA